MTGIIYGLIDSDTLELRYVGQTSRSLTERLTDHNKLHRHNSHLSRWVRASHINIITLERDPADLNEAEIRWIRETREQGARLLNITEGGDGFRGVHSPQSRAKMSEAHKGKSPSAGVRAKIGAASKGRQPWLGRKLSEEHRAKIGAASLGRKHSPESRAKISAALLGNQRGLGRKHTSAARAKMSAAQDARRAVVAEK